MYSISGNFSTGSPLLDIAMDGGIKRPGITLVTGGPGSAKTTFGLSALRGAGDVPVAYVGAEEIPTWSYFYKASNIETVVIRPTNGESAAEAIFSVIRNGAKLVVLDSIDACIPMAETFTKAGTRIPSAHTRLWYHTLAMLRPMLIAHSASALFISQVRTNMGKNKHYISSRVIESSYGDLRELTDCVLFLKRIASKSEYGELDRVTIQAKVVKSRNTLPGRYTDFTVWHRVGIDRATEILKYYETTGHAKRSGPYWIIGDEKFGPGYKAASIAMSKKLGIRSSW